MSISILVIYICVRCQYEQDDIYIYTHIYTYIHTYIHMFACRFSANHYYGMFHQVCDGTFSDTTFNHNNKAHNINIPTNGLIEEIEIPARSADNIR